METIEEVSDKLLEYISIHHGQNKEQLVEAINSNYVYPCLEELTASGFIISPDANRYFIEPSGQDIIKNYGTYSAFKLQRVTEYNAKQFKDKIELLLSETPYTNIDIMPLVRTYTDGKNTDGIARIRQDIEGIINDLKKDGFIEILPMGIPGFTGRSQNQFNYNPLKIKSKGKFYEYYKNKTTVTMPTQQHTYITTYGKNSPAAGRDLKVVDSKTKEEGKKALTVHKKILIWTIAIAVLTALILLWPSISKALFD